MLIVFNIFSNLDPSKPLNCHFSLCVTLFSLSLQSYSYWRNEVLSHVAFVTVLNFGDYVPVLSSSSTLFFLNLVVGSRNLIRSVIWFGGQDFFKDRVVFFYQVAHIVWFSLFWYLQLLVICALIHDYLCFLYHELFL